MNLCKSHKGLLQHYKLFKYLYKIRKNNLEAITNNFSPTPVTIETKIQKKRKKKYFLKTKFMFVIFVRTLQLCSINYIYISFIYPVKYFVVYNMCHFAFWDKMKFILMTSTKIQKLGEKKRNKNNNKQTEKQRKQKTFFFQNFWNKYFTILHMVGAKLFHCDDQNVFCPNWYLKSAFSFTQSALG